MAARSRRLAVAATAVVLVALAPGGAFGQADSDPDELSEVAEERDRIADEVDDVEQELARTEEEIDAVAAELHDAQARIDALETALSALRAERTTAERAAAQAREATRVATDELLAVTDLLAATEGQLDGSRQQLDDRAAVTYMRGGEGVGLTGLLLGTASDVGDLLHTSYYLGTVLEADKDLLEEVTSTALDLERLRGDADDARAELAAAQALADDRERQLVQLTTSAEALAAEAETERARQQSLFDRLEDKQAATRAQLAVLEEQSAAVEAELERLRAEGRGWRAGAPGAGTFVWPSTGRVSSVFGNRVHPIYRTTRFHAGLDIAGGFGRDVVAANAGLVLEVACTPGGYGCRVVIDHGGDIASLYAHLSSFSVAPGDVVAPGDLIAQTGSTGASTGPHLHFEIRVAGVPRDPMQWY